MILSEILQVKRVDGYFIVDDHKIKADRQASNGYGVLVIFEPSKLDYDFKAVIGPNRLCWFPHAESLALISKQLDLSDHLTKDLLGRGWGGVRPFPDKVADFLR
jgi:hypothetical protein